MSAEEEEVEYWATRGPTQSKVHLDPECESVIRFDLAVRPATEAEAEDRGICTYCSGEFPEIDRSGSHRIRRALEEMDPDEIPP